MRKSKVIIFGSIVLILLGIIYANSSGFSALNKYSPKKTNVSLQASRDKFSYKGQTGKDALSLLKKKAEVKQDKSGLVVSINGREAMASKREYWAFYVNGKFASVGPADYKTKDEDIIEWKINKY